MRISRLSEGEQNNQSKLYADSSSVPAIVTAIYQSPLLPKEVQFGSISYGGAPSPERMVGDLRKRFPNCGV
jgi:hypothetical protein